ncbi:hypothetical protein [Nocardia bovistercoris]|uniref:Uncharacterized protein n=1 Tax=Nocardia bovistercoris TaxID=2785916 RepID=A0A931N5C5_9NOCA|nr:hypothetical protein [Nocardia bovistercoris]MBH0778523.1 hypothetical protein [Nocardia bovistercoris]
MKKIATTLVTGILAVGATAALATGIAAAQPGVYVGNYATLSACQSDGRSPSTGGNYYTCEPQANGTYNLYVSY